MNVVVCAKPIPSPDSLARIMEGLGVLDRSGAFVLDDADTYGVELALQLVGVAGRGEVSLVAMAPAEGIEALRTALAMGAARGEVVVDPAVAGSDALSTSKVLAALIQRQRPNLVLCACESSDGYTGTVPVQIAELLDYPSVSFAKQVEFRGDSIVVKRQTERGDETVTCPLPAIVTVTAGIVEPRYPSFKGIMNARSKPILELTLADLGIAAAEVGVVGARQAVIEIETTPAREAGRRITDDGVAENEIIAALDAWKVI